MFFFREEEGLDFLDTQEPIFSSWLERTDFVVGVKQEGLEVMKLSYYCFVIVWII